jgi:hypothetical protein
VKPLLLLIVKPVKTAGALGVADEIVTPAGSLKPYSVKGL